MRYNPLFFKKIGFAGLNLNGGETIKAGFHLARKKRGEIYIIFHRAKNLAATEEKSSAAAYKNDDHIFAVIPKRQSYTSETKSYIILERGSILPTSYALMGSTVPISKIAPSYRKDGHKSYQSDG